VNAFLDQSGSRIPAPEERESLAKRAAVLFDLNPIVARIHLDSLFP
jgi:hypothetical protein